MIISNLISKCTEFFLGNTNRTKTIVEKNTICLNESSEEYITLPSRLKGFKNTMTEQITNIDGSISYYVRETLIIQNEELICPKCGCKMHIHQSFDRTIKHLGLGNNRLYICFKQHQLECSKCNATCMQKVQFKDDEHFISKQLRTYIEDLLATNNFTLKSISELTGVGRNIIKDIDKERLLKKYTTEDKKLFKPKENARYLSIDEFKLHNGNKYATHVIDAETGHVLWIQEGKKKQVVYDFINHVGLDWMNNVIAVACDMNSDFEEAFREKCPHIKIVFDYFHIVKNYNEKVIGAIRKDEQARLKEQGKTNELKTLMHSKYILTSSRETLKRKDNEAQEHKIKKKGSKIFNTPTITAKGGNESRYDKIMDENKLLFKAELIKEKLTYAYTLDDTKEMEKAINEIIQLCEEDGNKHLLWFAKLLKNHLYGIITHAEYKISSSKIEGINNKIKTIRRMGYGYPDDEYFFLKIIDATWCNG